MLMVGFWATYLPRQYDVDVGVGQVYIQDYGIEGRGNETILLLVEGERLELIKFRSGSMLDIHFEAKWWVM